MNSGTKKLFDALTLMIEAWQELGMHIKAPAEYEKLKQQRKIIGEAHGYN